MVDSDAERVSELFRLVTKKPPGPHLWDRDLKSVPANPALGREQQTERSCLKCKLVKITVHPRQGPAYRLWRRGDALSQFADDVTPECASVVLPETMKVEAVG